MKKVVLLTGVLAAGLAAAPVANAAAPMVPGIQEDVTNPDQVYTQKTAAIKAASDILDHEVVKKATDKEVLINSENWLDVVGQEARTEVEEIRQTLATATRILEQAYQQYLKDNDADKFFAAIKDVTYPECQYVDELNEKYDLIDNYVRTYRAYQDEQSALNGRLNSVMSGVEVNGVVYNAYDLLKNREDIKADRDDTVAKGNDVLTAKKGKEYHNVLEYIKTQYLAGNKPVFEKNLQDYREALDAFIASIDKLEADLKGIVNKNIEIKTADDAQVDKIDDAVNALINENYKSQYDCEKADKAIADAKADAEQAVSDAYDYIQDHFDVLDLDVVATEAQKKIDAAADALKKYQDEVQKAKDNDAAYKKQMDDLGWTEEVLEAYTTASTGVTDKIAELANAAHNAYNKAKTDIRTAYDNEESATTPNAEQIKAYKDAVKAYKDYLANIAKPNQAAYDELKPEYDKAVADCVEVAAGDKSHYNSATADADVKAKREAAEKALQDALAALNKYNENGVDKKNLADAATKEAAADAINKAFNPAISDYSQAVRKANMNDDANVQGKKDIADAIAKAEKDWTLGLELLKKNPVYAPIATFEDNEFCDAAQEGYKKVQEDLEALKPVLENNYQAETAVEYVDGDLYDALQRLVNGEENAVKNLLDAYQAHLDNVLQWYHKISPAVKEVYHVFEVLEYETYGEAPAGIKCATDDEYTTWVKDYTKALKELNDQVIIKFHNHSLDEAAYNELKAKADQYTAELNEITEYIKARYAQNLANYNTLLDLYNAALADYENIVATDVDHAETDCPSTTAKANVIAAKEAAKAALDTAKAALEDAKENGYLCTDPEADVDHNHYLAVEQLINDAYKLVNIDYSGAVRDAEANDAAYEEWTQILEDVQGQYTAAYNAIRNAELPVGTGHDECYEEFRDEALAALNGLYQTYVEPSVIWADGSYDAETLVAELAEIEANLKAILPLLEQPKNAMEEKVRVLQQNDADYQEFMVAAQNFFNQIFTPTLNLVTRYEIPYVGHDECYEEIRTEATEALEEIYDACNALVETAEYCWHHDEVNAELEGRGMTQHSMSQHLDELLYMLNEVLTKEVSDAYNTFQTKTGKLEANDAAYEEFVTTDLANIQAAWTQAYNATVHSEELLALYDADGLHRCVDTWEPIVDEFTAKLNAITPLIDKLAADAEESWHPNHTFIADRDAEPAGFYARLYGEEGIQALIGAYINEFNAKIEAERANLENERVYRYVLEDGLEELHRHYFTVRDRLAEIQATEIGGEYHGFPYDTDKADVAKLMQELLLIGSHIEKDQASAKGSYLRKECVAFENAYVTDFAKDHNDLNALAAQGEDAYNALYDAYELFKANVDAYEELFEAVEGLERQWTMTGNATVNEEEYQEDPFVQAILDDYRAIYFGLTDGINTIKAWEEESFNNRTLAAELEEVYAAIESVQIGFTQFINSFNDVVENAHHVTNGKTIYSDQEYYTIGFFREANEGLGNQAQEMFNTIDVHYADANITIYDADDFEAKLDENGEVVAWIDCLNTPDNEWDDVPVADRDANGHLIHQDVLGLVPESVKVLVNGEKQNELAFQNATKRNFGELERETLLPGAADITFRPGSLTVDGFTTKHNVYVEINVAAPVVEEVSIDQDVVADANSNKLVLRVNNPIDLTYTINSLVATTDNGEQISFADRVLNYAAGTIEFNLPEGTKTVELPEGFFTFRTGENTIARSAAKIVAVGGLTSIDSIIAMGEKAQIFDLQGRRVKAESLISGNSYIVNGEKVMVK